MNTRSEASRVRCPLQAPLRRTQVPAPFEPIPERSLLRRFSSPVVPGSKAQCPRRVRTGSGCLVPGSPFNSTPSPEPEQSRSPSSTANGSFHWSSEKPRSLSRRTTRFESRAIPITALLQGIPATLSGPPPSIENRASTPTSPSDRHWSTTTTSKFTVTALGHFHCFPEDNFGKSNYSRLFQRLKVGRLYQPSPEDALVAQILAQWIH